MTRSSDDIPRLDRAVWAGVRVAKRWGGSCHVQIPRSTEEYRSQEVQDSFLRIAIEAGTRVARGEP